MFTNIIYESFMEACQKEKIKKILKEVGQQGIMLDIGSGPGFLSELINVISIDIDLENLKKAKGLKVLASGDAIPFKSKVFDVAFCIDVVHLLKNTDEIFRVCKRAIISCFCNRYNYYEKLDFLKSIIPRDFALEKSFVIKGKEWDAVVAARRKN